MNLNKEPFLQDFLEESINSQVGFRAVQCSSIEDYTVRISIESFLLKLSPLFPPFSRRVYAMVARKIGWVFQLMIPNREFIFWLQMHKDHMHKNKKTLFEIFFASIQAKG